MQNLLHSLNDGPSLLQSPATYTVPYREVGCVHLKNAFLHISNIPLNHLAVQIPSSSIWNVDYGEENNYTDNSSYPNPNNLYFPQYVP